MTSGVYLNDDQSYGWYWSREKPQATPGATSFLPIFPNVRIGGETTLKSNSTYFPLLASDVTSLQFNTVYKYLTTPTGTYNLAYEMLFSDTNQPKPNLVPRAEIMIWIHTTFGQPPSTYKGDVTDGNNTYHLYAWSREDGRFYVAFIMDGQPKFDAHHTVNAKKLLENLVLDPKWYLLGVELGSEIVQGSGKIQVNQFSVNINGNEP